MTCWYLIGKYRGMWLILNSCLRPSKPAEMSQKVKRAHKEVIWALMTSIMSNRRAAPKVLGCRKVPLKFWPSRAGCGTWRASFTTETVLCRSFNRITWINSSSLMILDAADPPRASNPSIYMKVAAEITLSNHAERGADRWSDRFRTRTPRSTELWEIARLVTLKLTISKPSGNPEPPATLLRIIAAIPT